MIKTLHGLSTMYCNVATEIRIASETGYDAVEFLEHKILRYIENGYKAKDLKALLDKYDVKAACINALKSVERFQKKEKKELLKETRILCEFAAGISCPTIQVVPLNGLVGKSYKEIMNITSENICEIADIGKEYGVRFQIEVVAFSPINCLSQGLEIIRNIEKDNVGMVVDFWHLYAGGKTTPDDVAKLDKSIIYGVHFCDGKKPSEGECWDELRLRAFRPGEGDIPVQEWVDAVKSTGYKGVWSPELVCPKDWEVDLKEVAIICLENLNEFVGF